MPKRASRALSRSARRCGKGSDLSADHNAREFFISRIASRAAEEGRPLTELELSYLEWGRLEAEDQQERLHQQIDELYGEGGFERRMTELLRQAYRLDAAQDAKAPSRYRENYEELEGSSKDLELASIVEPVLTSKPTAMTSVVIVVVGAVGILFTAVMIILIIRYLFWR